ncbi:hypothetical protein EON68_00155 [archaeon]|nr:MAG: hypothetical protein EON68_00155 [archaeon]
MREGVAHYQSAVAAGDVAPGPNASTDAAAASVQAADADAHAPLPSSSTRSQHASFSSTGAVSYMAERGSRSSSSAAVVGLEPPSTVPLAYNTRYDARYASTAMRDEVTLSHDRNVSGSTTPVSVLSVTPVSGAPRWGRMPHPWTCPTSAYYIRDLAIRHYPATVRVFLCACD